MPAQSVTRHQPDQPADQPSDQARDPHGQQPGHPGPSVSASGASARQWLALSVISLAQLMVALDATIVNIALPSAQRDLGFSAADRQWVVTAYTLCFGGLLLLGGRAADLLGRRRSLAVGLVGFAAASAAGGLASGLVGLTVARGVQGAFAALLAPAALSLVAVTFTTPRERAKAFAVYGSIAGSGAAIGLVLGGVLAEGLSWRWCLFVNVPIAVVALVGSRATLGAHDEGAASPQTTGARPPLDVAGAVLATGGLAALVWACTEAVRLGWSSGRVTVLLAASLVTLAVFVVVEHRAASPLLPLRLVLERNRAGAYLAVGIAIAGMFGLFLFLTYYLQVVRAMSPVHAGLAFLPMTVATLVASGAVVSRLMPHVAPRTLMVPGLLVAAAGMGLLTTLDAGSDYITLVLPVEILLGAGMSAVMVPAFSVATSTVERREAGVASAIVNTASQVGGTIGTSVLNAVAASATAGYLATRPGARSAVADGLVHGYATAAAWAAGGLLAAAVLTALMVTAPRPHAGPEGSS